MITSRQTMLQNLKIGTTSYVIPLHMKHRIDGTVAVVNINTDSAIYRLVATITMSREVILQPGFNAATSSLPLMTQVD